MSSSNETSPATNSDSSLPPVASDSPPPPPDESSSSSNNEISPQPPPLNSGDSSSSTPPPTSNPTPTTPPLTPSTDFNNSAVKTSPTPLPSPSPPPPPSTSSSSSSPPPPPVSQPPPPGSPSEPGSTASPPPPPHHSPPGTPTTATGTPPSFPIPPPATPPNSTNNSAVLLPHPPTNHGNPPPGVEPTTPQSPPQIGNPNGIPPPGATPETTNPIPGLPPAPVGKPTTQTPDSGFLPPPSTSTTTASTRNSDHSSPSSTNSKPDKSSSSSSSGSGQSGHNENSETVIGVALAGVFIIFFITAFFVISKKKKRRREMYTGPYLPPNNFCVKSDGNYYPHQHMGNSSPPEGFYTQVPHTPTPIGNSFGSQKGGTIYSSSGGVGGGGGGLGPDSGVINSAKSFFSYEELMEITRGFSRQNIIGEGGFGCVYKGWLQDGKPVAVKQLKAGSGQGEREFKAEVEVISRVHHRYLLSLVGYCISQNQRLLIYEYVPNKTLEHHLHSGNGVPVLDWPNRLKIALGAAKGLAYLHEDCQPKIIHRDIKSANILLDDAFEAQVADFGLAKLTNDTNTHVSTRVMGTFGYMAPEYASSGKLTDRSDVFSFGVVLLELITGRKPVDPTQPLGDESLVEWARPLLIRAIESGEIADLVDPRLGKQYVESEVFRMIEAAAACVRHSAAKRPRMVQVVRALDTENDMSDLSNGVKYGQSTIYNSGQYNQDISKFRRMALGSGDYSEYDINSGEFNSRDMSSTQSWTYQDNSSCESESRAFNVYSSQNPYTSRRI